MSNAKPFTPPIVVAGAILSTMALAAGPVPGAEREQAGKPPRTAGAASRSLPATIITPADMQKAIGKHRGRVVVLHLWATWCLPCLDELPMVGKFARDMKGKGVELLSVSLDDPTQYAAEKVSKLINERTNDSLAKTIVRIDDPDAFISSVDPKWEGTIPALFAYDRSGRLRRAHVGESTRAQLDRFVGDLIAAETK